MKNNKYKEIDDLRKVSYCITCETEQSEFHIPEGYWGLREKYYCTNCQSRPRERALTYVLEKLYPNWKDLTIHESSPVMRGASRKLKLNCPNYSTSQFFPKEELGATINGIRNENLEKLTFEDESFDLFISLDVMEHVFNPDKSFPEIARILKPGGAHIFTVPLMNQHNPTEVAATIDDDGKVTHLLEAQYHGNPVDDEGSLVTYRWGYDITDFISKHAGMPTSIYFIDSVAYSIRGLYSEVVVSRKPK